MARVSFTSATRQPKRNPYANNKYSNNYNRNTLEIKKHRPESDLDTLNKIKYREKLEKNKNIIKSQIDELNSNVLLKQCKLNREIEYLKYQICESYIALFFDTQTNFVLKLIEEFDTNIEFDFWNTVRENPYVAKFSSSAKNDDTEDAVEINNQQFIKLSKEDFNFITANEDLNYIGSVLIDIDNEGKEHVRKLFINTIPDMEKTKPKKKIEILPDDVDITADVLINEKGQYYKEVVSGYMYKTEQHQLDDMKENLEYAIDVIKNAKFNPKYPFLVMNEETMNEIQALIQQVIDLKITSNNILPIQTDNYFVSNVLQIKRTEDNILVDSFVISKKEN